MLRSMKEREGYTVTATDGDIGTVINLLLDDKRWVVRYLVVEATGLEHGRRLLVSPISFLNADWMTRRLQVALTKEKVRSSPSIDVDEPVTPQHERAFHQHYAFADYWGHAGPWGMGAYPGLLATGGRVEPPESVPDKPSDVRLRNARTLRGYHLEGSDQTVGHIADFIVDDETWEVRYLVVDTSNWWFGKKVLISPHWAIRVAWEEKNLYVGLTRQAVKDSPEWNPGAGVNRQYEVRLYDYYGRPAYWDGADGAPTSPTPVGLDEFLP